MDLTFSKSIGSYKVMYANEKFNPCGHCLYKNNRAHFLHQPITWIFLSINLLGCAETEHNLNEV